MKEFHISLPELLVRHQNVTVEAETEEEAIEKLRNANAHFDDIEWWDSESHEVMEAYHEEAEVTKVNHMDS